MNHTYYQILVALEAEGANPHAPRAHSKFKTFIKLSDGDFDKAIKWTAASIKNDAEYEERCRDHGCGWD